MVIEDTQGGVKQSDDDACDAICLEFHIIYSLYIKFHLYAYMLFMEYVFKIYIAYKNC